MPIQRPVWAHRLPYAILLMAPFDVLASLAMDAYLPVVPTMPRALDTSPDLIQLSLSLYLVSLGLGQVLFGPLSDRLGRRPVLLGGGGVFIAASMLLATAPDGGSFLAFRVLQALGASAVLVATFATIRDAYGDRPEGASLYGSLSAILAFVPAIGPMVGAVIAQAWGWRAIFTALAILTVAPVVHAARRWPETRPSGSGRGASMGPILRSRRFLIFTLAFGVAMGAFFVFLSVSPRVLIERVGLTELEFSLAFATTAAAMILTARTASRQVARWGVEGTVVRGMGLLVVSALAFAAAGLGATSLWSVLLPSWMMAVGVVITVSVTANGALAEFGDRAGLAVGLYFAGQSLVVGILGTAAVLALDGSTVWPVIAWCSAMPLVVIAALGRTEADEARV